MEQQKKLIAIFFSDIVGYTAVMDNDEDKALAMLENNRSIHNKLIGEHKGRLLKEMGDGILASFESVSRAVFCALAIRKACKTQNISIRIGIDLGEVIVQDDDIFGRGVNIASRLQELAPPGGILFSESVQRNIHNKKGLETEFVQEAHLKNVHEPVSVYRLIDDSVHLHDSDMESVHKPTVRQVTLKTSNRGIFIAAILGLVGLLLAYLIYTQFSSGEGSKASAPYTIAVLPFENLTGEPDLEYFANGMTQELCNRLSRLQNLKVTSRMAVIRFKGTNLSPTEIAKKLGVEYLIEGSIRKQGIEVRINAQLIEAATGFQLASYDFKGNMEEALEAQDKAALGIAEELHLDLKAEEVTAIRKRYTDNYQAYNAYLKGWMLLESLHFDVNPSREKFDGAKQHFEEAMAQDSSYALAYAGLSMVESNSYYYGFQEEYDRLERAENLARKALKLDRYLPEGHQALAETFAYIGRHEEAIKSYRVSLDLEQDNPIGWCLLAYSCKDSDPIDLDGAETAARMAIKQGPTYIWSYMILGEVLRRKEQFTEAIETYQYCIQLNSTWHSPYINIGDIHLTQGDYALAMDMFRRADELSDAPRISVRMSFVHAERGEKELALAELEKAFQAGYSYFDFVESNSHYHSLRNDKEFRALISKFRNQEAH